MKPAYSANLLLAAVIYFFISIASSDGGGGRGLKIESDFIE